MGVATLALDAGRHLQVPAAVAILSAVYAVGQVLGPVAVAPLPANGFHAVLFVAGGVVATAAVVAMLLRVRFPVADTLNTSGVTLVSAKTEPILHQ